MKIFKYRTDSNRFKNLTVSEIDIGRLDVFDGRSLIHYWKPLAVFPLSDTPGDRKAKFSDFPPFSPQIPVFSKKAHDCLFDLVKNDGEFLPMETDAGEFYAFNVTTVLDALDLQTSDVVFVPNTNKIMFIRRLSFFKDRISNCNVFKISQFPGVFLFVNERFAAGVETHSLTGLALEFVWSCA